MDRPCIENGKNLNFVIFDKFQIGHLSILSTLINPHIFHCFDMICIKPWLSCYFFYYAVYLSSHMSVLALYAMVVTLAQIDAMFLVFGYCLRNCLFKQLKKKLLYDSRHENFPSANFENQRLAPCS